MFRSVASGDLRDAGRLHHWRAALAFGEARSLFFVGVDATKRLAIGIIHGNQKMVVTAPAILAEFRLLVTNRLSRGLIYWFSHRKPQRYKLCIHGLCQGKFTSASTSQDSNPRNIKISCGFLVRKHNTKYFSPQLRSTRMINHFLYSRRLLVMPYKTFLHRVQQNFAAIGGAGAFCTRLN
jgi:hypothetical protein